LVVAIVDKDVVGKDWKLVDAGIGVVLGVGKMLEDKGVEDLLVENGVDEFHWGVLFKTRGVRHLESINVPGPKDWEIA
jgi:hypothetical protein